MICQVAQTFLHHPSPRSMKYLFAILRPLTSKQTRAYLSAKPSCPLMQFRTGFSTGVYYQDVSDKGKDESSWVQLLYEDCGNNSANLKKLRRKLDVALSSTRSHERGDLLPYLIVQDLIKFLNSLDKIEDKAVFFSHLAEKLGVDFNAVLSKLRSSEDVIRNERLKYRFQQNLIQSLTPPYKHLFDDISKHQYGTQFLVNMRKDLLQCFREKHLPKTTRLLSFDTCLKEHLAKWFANGFLDLEVLSWEKSPASLLEKIMKYEAVHVIDSWHDMKTRSGSGRRIFTFSHRLMPDEPLVILHTLIGSKVPDNIQKVLVTPPYEPETCDVTTATFYSVSSTQRGLDGIGLGNLLIKRVVEHLQTLFFNISIFVTLSPIPGFKKWLDFHLCSIEQDKVIPSDLQGICNDTLKGFVDIKKKLSNETWFEDAAVSESLKEPLMDLCARYLIHSKRRGFASDPVAHFHLRNGASIWRLNWLGNSNSHGIKSSYGIMVNYMYTLEQLEENNNNYVQSGKIAISEEVRELCR